MKHVKKILYVIGVLFFVCTTIILYLSKDYIMHFYYIDKIQKKYQESLTYCNDSFDIYLKGSPEEALPALNKCNSYLSENLKYLKNKKKYILFGFDQMQEDNILFDIGMNYAYIAIQYEKKGNKDKYDENIQKALQIVSSVWKSIETEIDLRRLIKKFESNNKSEQTH